jgi:hemoglobin
LFTNIKHQTSNIKYQKVLINSTIIYSRKIMKKTILTALCSGALLFNAQLYAQPSMKPAPADDSVYQAFGAKPGLVKLMDHFVDGLLKDVRTAPFFATTNQERLKTLLVEQLCQEGGGPCKYTGRDMASSHAGMSVAKSHFNALVEVLQVSMDAQGIPFTAQNKMLARLAPMNRDIISK